MSENGSALSMRADLIRRRVWMGDRRMWVIKDPLARSFSYLSDQEYELLSLADGQRSLSEIARECSNRFAPQYISSESLVRFFADARAKGLVLVEGSGLPHHLRREESRRRWWHNPLAIRLPGLNPDRFLDRIGPCFRPLFSPVAVVLALLLILVAMVIAAVDFASLSQHITIAATRFAVADGVAVLLIVISLTKILHELAHAMVCKHFGGECRELGVMFLVGVPCLYCDVSDAWLLDRRWKRVLVSAAGMAAELTLAAIATLVWALSGDGPVRDVCVTVMVVCSVTTMLFNGNPLLRYDGYYILSDLSGIPNLAAQSTSVIRSWLRRFLWATPAPDSSDSVSLRGVFVVCYGLASGLYRTAVYLLILWMLYRLAEHYELGGPAGLLALLAISWFCFKSAKSILAPPDRSVRRASMSTRRPALVVGGVAMIGGLISLVPLPRSVVAPLSIQPAGAQLVFVRSEGAIAESMIEGAVVIEGQVVARLHNPEVDRELVEMSSQCERLASELESLRQRRNSSPEASSRIPVVEKALEEAVKQKRVRENVAAQLTLASPRSGRIFAPPQRPPQTTDDRYPRFWTGTPLEPLNRGAWLGEGTVLCIVGDTTMREAILMLRQQDVELIVPNQPVKLLLADTIRGAVTGRVLEVAASPSEEIPAELQRSGRVNPSAGSDKAPLYQVRVSLDRTSAPLPVRLTGHAQVSVSSASILARIARFLSDSFG